MQKQTADAILMVRPAGSCFNPETADSNAFQSEFVGISDAEILNLARVEFDAFVSKLQDAAIEVLVIDDTAMPRKPDAIFPNNWVTFHSNGDVFLFPMQSPLRRQERRDEILDQVGKRFKTNRIIDLSCFEEQGRFLEGTGSIVFDHVNKIAYACRSPRTDMTALGHYAKLIGYTTHVFEAFDANAQAIYHTNVMLTVTSKLAVICLASIRDNIKRADTLNLLKETGHEIVEISLEQMNNFAGNMLEVRSMNGVSHLVMSESALKSLDKGQLDIIENHHPILSADIPTIEKIGGGSVRCMMAEIFCERIN